MSTLVSGKSLPISVGFPHLCVTWSDDANLVHKTYKDLYLSVNARNQLFYVNIISFNVYVTLALSPSKGDNILRRTY